MVGAVFIEKVPASSESCKAEVYTSLPELLVELAPYMGAEECASICDGEAEVCGKLVFSQLGIAGRLKEELGVTAEDGAEQFTVT